MELESIKVRIHLHSFTYDYHLRAIHSYIIGQKLFFYPGYNLLSFLDDFIRYYQKSPNYSRNLIYSGRLLPFHLIQIVNWLILQIILCTTVSVFKQANYTTILSPIASHTRWACSVPTALHNKFPQSNPI